VGVLRPELVLHQEEEEEEVEGVLHLWAMDAPEKLIQVVAVVAAEITQQQPAVLEDPEFA
jgi:hypothetical protein